MFVYKKNKHNCLQNLEENKYFVIKTCGANSKYLLPLVAALSLTVGKPTHTHTHTHTERERETDTDTHTCTEKAPAQKDT